MSTPLNDVKTCKKLLPIKIFGLLIEPTQSQALLGRNLTPKGVYYKKGVKMASNQKNLLNRPPQMWTF